MQPDGQQDAQVSAEAVQTSIDELRRLLTVILACVQLLQRESQRPEGVVPEIVERRAAMIFAASTGVIDTLHHLEDVSSESI